MIGRGREGASQEGGMTSEVTFGIKVGKSACCGEEDACNRQSRRELGKNRKE